MNILAMLWQVNYLHVLIASIIWFIFGAFWYSPILFWAQRKKYVWWQERTKKDMIKASIVWFMMMFVWVTIVSLLVAWAWMMEWVKLWWLLALLIWSSMLWWAIYEGKPRWYILITLSYILLVWILIGGVVGWL